MSDVTASPTPVIRHTLDLSIGLSAKTFPITLKYKFGDFSSGDHNLDAKSSTSNETLALLDYNKIIAKNSYNVSAQVQWKRKKARNFISHNFTAICDNSLKKEFITPNGDSVQFWYVCNRFIALPTNPQPLPISGPIAIPRPVFPQKVAAIDDSFDDQDQETVGF